MPRPTGMDAAAWDGECSHVLERVGRVGLLMLLPAVGEAGEQE